MGSIRTDLNCCRTSRLLLASPPAGVTNELELSLARSRDSLKPEKRAFTASVWKELVDWEVRRDTVELVLGLESRFCSRAGGAEVVFPIVFASGGSELRLLVHDSWLSLTRHLRFHLPQ